MSEHLTFANFSPDRHYLSQIYQIGSTDSQPGVIIEMADVFDHHLGEGNEVDNLGKLIGAIGPAKELQDNIDNVQAKLGTDKDAIAIARDWVERSGLLTPVERYYNDAAQAVDPSDPVEAVVVTGGVRNWEMRRALRLVQFSGRFAVGKAYLVGGAREMKTREGKDVEEGMTEADYFSTIVQPQLENLGIDVTTLAIDSTVGDEIMTQAAERMSKKLELTRTDGKIAVVSNAGAWVQNVGQMSRALRATDAFAEAQIIGVSDGFRLGKTGEEPTSTHQNPLTALGQIARNAQELARHTN